MSTDNGAFSAKPLAPPAPAIMRGKDLSHFVVDCLERGESVAEIHQKIAAMGYDPAQIGPWIEKIVELRKQKKADTLLPQYPGDSAWDYSSQYERTARRHMWIGAIVCVVGIVLTIATYRAAEQSGGTYTVFYGAIFWGAVQFFYGLSRQ